MATPCDSKPFIKLEDDNSNAPTLNYNMEQENCLDLSSISPFQIDASWFKPEFSASREDQFWLDLKRLTRDQIKDMLKQDILGHTSKFFHNYELIHSSPVPVVFHEVTNMYDPKYTGGGTSPLSFMSVHPFYKNSKGQNTLAVGLKGDHKSIIHHEVNHLYNDVATKEVKTIAVPAVKFPPFHAVEFDIDYIVDKIIAGFKPHITKKADGKIEMQFLAMGIQLNPKLFIVYESMLCSYLGNYGAGKTVGTFSLLPGEKTTISVRTYKDSHTSRSKAENVLDSMSEASANSFETNLQEQKGSQVDSSTSNAGSASTTTTTTGAGSVLNLFFHANNAVTTSTPATASNAQSTGTIESNVKDTLDKHVQQSNKFRQVDVNTTTNSDVSNGEETSTIRELENINVSRTLNFVFRQLLQEHIVVHWLKHVKFAFGNGDPSNNQIVLSHNLKDMLSQVIISTKVETVFDMLFKHVLYVFNYQDDPIQMFECREFISPSLDCACDSRTAPQKTECLWVRKRGLQDEYGNITVPGVILGVTKHTMQTHSVIVDALLGQGEALDCYNTNMQQQNIKALELKNDQLTQAMAVIDGITDPVAKADAYKKMFGVCCDNDDTPAQ